MPTDTEVINGEMFSAKQVAELFGVTAETVRDWIATGKLEAMRLPNGRYRVARSAVIAFAKHNYGPDDTPELGGS